MNKRQADGWYPVSDYTVKPTIIDGVTWYQIWAHGSTDGQLHVSKLSANNQIKRYKSIEMAIGQCRTYLGRIWGH